MQLKHYMKLMELPSKYAALKTVYLWKHYYFTNTAVFLKEYNCLML